MPRDGSGNFTAPFPDVVDGTTIESAVHNGTVSDFVTDANAARPIIAGGTGATSASAARANLATEVRSVEVSNYDTHVFEAGSFQSNPGATGEPEAGMWTCGTAIVLSPDAIVLEAYAGTPTFHTRYTRVKWSSWGPWVKHVDAALGGTDGEGIAAVTGDMWYGVRGGAPSSVFVVNSESDLSGTNLFEVPKLGTYMTFNALTSHAQLNLNKKVGGGTNTTAINGMLDGVIQWTVAPGGQSAANDFAIHRYDGGGGFAGTPLTISRATGNAAFANQVTVGSGLIVANGLVSNTAGVVAVLNGTGGSSNIGFQKSGVDKWYVGPGAADASDNFNIYSTAMPQFPLQLSHTTGIAYFNYGVVIPATGTAITINPPSGGAGTLYAQAGVNRWQVGSGVVAGDDAFNFYSYGVGGGYMPLKIINGSGQVQVQSPAISSSFSTGGLLVNGGLGVGGNISVGGTINIQNVVSGQPSVSLTAQAQVPVASGGNEIVAGSGGWLLLVSNLHQGFTSMYMGDSVQGLQQIGTPNSFVAPTTTPPAGYQSVCWDGAAYVRLYNNAAAVQNFAVYSIRIR